MESSSPPPDCHVVALVRSLGAVPPGAVPAIVDCVLASSSLSPDTLFSSLLNYFPDSTEDICSYNVASYSTALCHLINDTNSPSLSLRLLIERVFIPVLARIDSNESELLDQVIVLLCSASLKFNLWELLDETLIPLCLRSIYADIGLITQNDDSVVYQWSTTNSMKHVYLQPVNSIHVLASVAASSLQKSGGRVTSKIVSNLAVGLSTLILEMLRQLPNYVATAIRVLFPVVLCLVNEVSGAWVCVHEKEYKISWFSFLRDTWECCGALFPLGNLERLHAYSILTLSLSFISKSATNGIDPQELFVVHQKEFWQEIRKGLVDRDPLIRKKALYLLKASVNQYVSSTTAPTFINQHSNNVDFLADTMNVPSCMTSDCEPGSRGHATMTKRERWADKEAKSMGVGKACNTNDSCTTSQDRWRVFMLLYEMLEEYGTHLVEAAWTHQVGLLIESTWHKSQNNQSIHSSCQDDIIHMRDIGVFYWMTVLWERGFCHENPQVRSLIMESFLQIAWENHDNCAQKVPTDFVLGPLLRGLNDVVHHKDFGIGGAYNSKTIKGATKFFSEFCSQLTLSDCLFFVWSLASAARHDNFGRAGLMTLSFCIASSSCHFSKQKSEFSTCVLFKHKFATPVELLDALGIVIERSKQHFNPKYRLQVCEKVLEATSSLISPTEIQLDLLLHFLSTIPREFTDTAGPLRVIVQKWLGNGSSDMNNSKLVKELTEFPIKFLKHGSSEGESYLFDDEDALAWENEAQRWARMFLLVALQEQQLKNIFVFFWSHKSALHDLDGNLRWRPVKFLILIINFVEELQKGCKRLQKSDLSHDPLPSCNGELIDTLVSILENLTTFAGTACPVLWSEDNMEKAPELPSSIKGKLGGPSLRRLTLSLIPSVLQAIFAMKAIGSVLSWCQQFKQDHCLENSAHFLWDFAWRVIQSPTCKTKTGAELHSAAFESLSHGLKSLSTSFSSLILVHAHTNQRAVHLNGMLEEPPLDPFMLGFLESINCLLAHGALSRSRRAVLMSWKWLCLEALLSIPYNAVSEATLSHSQALSDSTLRSIFLDIVESLEHTGENSVLSILKCVRLVVGLAKKHQGAASSWLDSQMVMHLVKSSWILHESCNKRRVAPIAALLSAVIHRDIFPDLEMHESSEGQKGPLKWFVEKLLDEGAKSPRTIRLAALHLTGLWLLYPETTKYYIRELKLLSLYGSVAFDEDFEGELSENQDAKAEVSMLAQSPDCEFTEAFINTELYARVSVAVLFHQFANFSKVAISAKDCSSAIYCGKLFLLELLDSAVNDRDISKELYKKYSSVHRRKVRAWQMICILSYFVENDIVEEVTSKLHLCLYRTNLPAVRQYLETFAIQIYLKFPDLVEQQLLPIFHDNAMRMQALSSYVFIAANVILHSKELTLQIKHLKGLLPSIIPLLTSHHHSLRGFTQLLVHRVLTKLWPLLGIDNLETKSFERKCFEDLKVYLAENPDCARLRASMEVFFDNFDPNVSSSPEGVFSSHHEGADFECVPISLMDRVIDFLNEARGELRHSVAKDSAIIKSESYSLSDYNVDNHVKDVTIDFQKKITLGRDKSGSDLPPLLLEMEKEDQLFNSALQSRNEALVRIKQSQQNLIVVASLLDRIPNQAGLARTCEVFKASGLAVADRRILQDKQFQLISVTAEKWLPILEVPVSSVNVFLEKKRREGYSLIGLEQTANSTPLDQFSFPNKTVLVLG